VVSRQQDGPFDRHDTNVLASGGMVQYRELHRDCVRVPAGATAADARCYQQEDKTRWPDRPANEQNENEAAARRRCAGVLPTVSTTRAGVAPVVCPRADQEDSLPLRRKEDFSAACRCRMALESRHPMPGLPPHARPLSSPALVP
jgi:hypothetical protein